MRKVHQPGDPDPRSILVVLPTWVGDFVMATPTLRAIRNRFGGAHITFLIEPNLRELIRGGDWMDECVEWPTSDGRKRARTPFHKRYRDLAWDLRRRRFDWAVLLPNSFAAALIARLAGAKRRIGYDRDGRGLLLTDHLPVQNRRRSAGCAAPRGSERSRIAGNSARTEVRGSLIRPRGLTLDASRKGPEPAGARMPVSPGRYIPMALVAYYADLAEAIGCERPTDRLELFTTPDCDEAVQERLASGGIAHHKPLVVISPGARYGAAKCWFPERFAAVADRLIEAEDAAVAVTCGPGEEPIVRQIRSAMRSAPKRKVLIFDDPLLTLGHLKSLIRRSDLLICNDAGPRHFAKAFDVPVVTVFGPTHPKWTETSYESERIVRIEVDCGPCQQRICPLGHLDCMTGVSVDAVFAVGKELLEAGVAQKHT